MNRKSHMVNNRHPGERFSPGALNGLLAVFVVACATLFFSLTPDIRLTRYVVLCYAMIAACGVWIAVRSSAPVGIMFLWGAVICYVHTSTSMLAALAMLIYAIALIFVVSQEIKRTWIYNTICVIAMFCVCEQILQLIGLPVMFRPAVGGHHTLTGIMGNVNETSAFLAVCLPAFFRRRWVWALPVPIAGIILAESLIGVMAGAVIGCVYVALEVRGKRRKVVKAISAAVLVGLGMAYMVFVDRFDWEMQKNSRLLVWQESVDAALEKPFLGWGFGQYSAVIPLISSPMEMDVRIRRALYEEVEDKKALTNVVNRWSKGDVADFYAQKKYPVGSYFEAHNEYVETLFAAGIPGLVFLIIAIGAILRRGEQMTVKVRGTAFGLKAQGAGPSTFDLIPFYGFLASCVAATVFFVWQIVPIAIITVVWAGMCLKDSSSFEVRGFKF